MDGIVNWLDDDWNPGPGPLGAAYSLSSEGMESDIVERLRDVVEEVTGKPVERHLRKIGFY